MGSLTSREDTPVNDADANALLVQPLPPEYLAVELGMPVAEVPEPLEWRRDEGLATPCASAVAPGGSTVATSWQLQVPNQVRQELACRNGGQLDGNQAARRARREGWGR